MKRRGLSLLEVTLALAILGASIAVIVEMVGMGTRSALQARDLTAAQLYAESKMAEIAAQAEPMQSIGQTPLDVEQEWLYSVEAVPAQTQGLMIVTVTVEKNVESTSRAPLSYTLTRWILDPNSLPATTSASGTSQ
jgi:Tfp pilus assembly protein PilV